MTSVNGATPVPSAFTRQITLPASGEQMITFLLPQLPPRAASTFASACGGPPDAATFCNLPLAKNAMLRPSGDQNGKLAPSVPCNRVMSGEPMRCTQSIGNPESFSGDTKAIMEPS